METKKLQQSRIDNNNGDHQNNRFGVVLIFLLAIALLITLCYSFYHCDANYNSNTLFFFILNRHFHSNSHPSPDYSLSDSFYIDNDPPLYPYSDYDYESPLPPPLSPPSKKSPLPPPLRVERLQR